MDSGASRRCMSLSVQSDWNLDRAGQLDQGLMVRGVDRQKEEYRPLILHNVFGLHECPYTPSSIRSNFGRF